MDKEKKDLSFILILLSRGYLHISLKYIALC